MSRHQPALGSAEVLRLALVEQGCPWDVRWVDRTRSTNADLMQELSQGLDRPTVLLCPDQTAGRGRRDRRWVSAPGLGLALSVALPMRDHQDEMIPRQFWTWLPLIVGQSAAQALQSFGVPCRVKWPNDGVVEPDSAHPELRPGKIFGVLLEATPTAVVVGVGINLLHTPDDLPTPESTALHLAKPRPGVVDSLGSGTVASNPNDAYPLHWDVACRFLLEFWSRWQVWQAQHGNVLNTNLARECREGSATIGKRVRVIRSGQPDLTGTAVGIDDQGLLLVESAEQPNAVLALSAGDVVHLRPVVDGS